MSDVRCVLCGSKLIEEVLETLGGMKVQVCPKNCLSRSAKISPQSADYCLAFVLFSFMSLTLAVMIAVKYAN